MLKVETAIPMLHQGCCIKNCHVMVKSTVLPIIPFENVLFPAFFLPQNSLVRFSIIMETSLANQLCVFICAFLYIYANGEKIFVPICTLKLYNLTTQYKHDQNVCVGV